VTNAKDGTHLLKWTVKNTSKEELQFAVYRFAANEKISINSSANLIAIVRGTNYTDTAVGKTSNKYVVTALDRLHNESDMSNSAE
jgi:fibronectin type 3 domain-containing protein